MEKTETATEGSSSEQIVKLADHFGSIKLIPANPIMATYTKYMNDTDPKKVNLGMGAYRDDSGNSHVFDVVKKVEEQILKEQLDKEYNMAGLPGVIAGSQVLIFGKDSPVLKEGRVATMQSLSGTGALRVAFQFIKNDLPHPIYIPTPTWVTHRGMIECAGLTALDYPYYDPSTKKLDIKAMLECLEKAEPKCIVILHTSAHNPTGVDPTHDQWKQICEVIKKKDLLPFFDSAYQGFASGDLEEDAWPIRYFASQGLELLVAQSFAKNMGLYGQRIGALHILCHSKQQKESVDSQLLQIVRLFYLNPPLHGGRIVERILNNPENMQAWKSELKEVAFRIINMRTELRKRLEALGTPGDWSHISDQKGMFSFMGLSEKTCDVLINKYHVHLMRNSRICMAGVNTSNIDYLAQSIKAAIEETK